MSSIAFWIFLFHCGGMILRTGLLHRFESAAAPNGLPQDVLRECCGKPKAFHAHLGTHLLFYPSGGHKPMALQRF
jgi:hypothetical protein